MASKKPVNKMSAEELFKLARRREQEEAEAERAANRERIKELRDQRRQLIAEHKKELAQLDREINALGGRAPRAAGGGRKQKGLSDQVISILEKSGGEASTKDIRTKLEQKGLSTDNLAQTMAYLKRTGRVVSPSRAVYSLG